MYKKTEFAGIDCFRIIAAILIISIHTSPLAGFSEIGDFILTRIIARVAVPFFFMTSGFFLISRYSPNAGRLVSFIKKTALIYGAAILICLPVNIYNGYFKMEYVLPNIIKDIIFDGTLYHLWYLPASIIGACIAWYLVKKFDYQKAIVFSAVLYLFGLFGDSYYGMTEQIPFLNGLYKLLFQVFDYTRNGIFFAPIFFVFGGYIADKSKRNGLLRSIFGFTVSLALMLCEGVILHKSGLQRHDSMYIFLLPCTFFLFGVLLCFKGSRKKLFRTASLIIYTIHPIMIIAVRLFSKLFNLQKIFVENAFFHFLAVCILSAGFGFLAAYLWNKRRGGKSAYQLEKDRAYIEINLNNLRHNVTALKKVMPNRCRLMAVVKAEAYGHGAYEIAAYLDRIGIRAYAVASIDEGIKLREHGIHGEILILGYTSIYRAADLKKYDLSQTLIDYEYAQALNKQGVKVKAHIKIDTGMHRLGIDFNDTEKVKDIFSMRNINVCGIYTHLCCSDSLTPENVSYTKGQIEKFYNLLAVLKNCGINLPKIHIQSSYGLLNYSELKCDYVRAGISLYGLLSSPNDKANLELDLRPVLSLKSKVVMLRKINAGESIGYGRAYTAVKDSVIATLPIGYADGYPRNLSCGKGYVLVNGQYAPIVGRICMDQLQIDVTDIPDIKTGTTVTLIGKDGNEEITAPALADSSESIANELLSRMGKRIKIIICN